MQREVDQVTQEIESITGALSRISDDDPKLRYVLIFLANAHARRFNLQSEPDDIQHMIKYNLMALNLTPDEDPGLPDLLSTLGVAHCERFQRLGDKHDMEKAVEYKSRALDFIPEGHPDLPRQLASLAVSHRDRFKHLGEPEDIKKAIECDSRAVAMTPEEDPSLPAWLAKLGISYGFQFQRFGELNDLESAIDYESRALALTPDDHPDLSSRLINLAVSYKIRFENLGEMGDLEKAIGYESRALDLTSDDNPDLATYLANLAMSHKLRFESLGELNDLEQAIEYEFHSLDLTPDGHPDLSGRFANLAVSYKSRFENLGEQNDLERTIEYELRALDLTPDNHPDFSRRLANLAVSHNHRFESLGEPIDLEQAIEYESRALGLTPDDHPDLSAHLSNKAVSHSYRFRCLGELSDLEQAIKYKLRALAMTADDHPLFPRRLANLAVSHSDRFQHLGDLNDLQEAIAYGSRALAAITCDHPHWCLWHFYHAISYVSYYEYSHDLSHLQQSLALFRSACMPWTGSPRDRFNHASQWASHAVKHRVLDPVEAYQVTIDLLPQYIWLGATIDQRYQDLKSIQTLAIDAAHVAIVSSNYSLALEWLEHARCVVWNQNLMLRSPVDQLLASHPALATRLQTVANKLNVAASSSRQLQAFSRPITSEQAAREHHRLAKEYEKLLVQARAQPGFEDFLRPIKASRLTDAARTGPIVVINSHHDRCDALLILPQQVDVTHIPLPNFNVEKALTARLELQRSVESLRLSERGVERRPMVEVGQESEFENVLVGLWYDVVKPVLDHLGYTNVPTDNPPHITWCPTGPITFLPLHAAGDYDQPRSRVFDYVISSYTPTLTALLESTSYSPSRNSRVLTVGQAATPGHARLPGTALELDFVRAHMQDKVEYTELVDQQATVTAVLDQMERHDWVHLACHAHQNVGDPKKSGFFLSDGVLDLDEINRRSLKGKGLAFLSACQTATGDKTLPDEAVHLASGMLMAGYSSVIATMWSVGDAQAPLVADKVYSRLMKEETLGNGEAGRALHYAVGELRERVGEKEVGSWVPFIHIGS